MWLRSAAFVKVSHSRSPPLSLSLSLFLAVGGTFGLFVSHRSIRRGRTRRRSVGRSAQCRRRRPLRSFSAMLRREK